VLPGGRLIGEGVFDYRKNFCALPLEAPERGPKSFRAGAEKGRLSTG